MNIEYRIEATVPPPQPKAKFPFAKMKLGESFLVPGTEENALRSAARYWAAKLNWKFAIRVDAKEPGKFRCWRVTP